MFPILFQSGPIVIYTHDFFSLVGLLVGLLVYYIELKRRDMLDYRIFRISIAAIVGGSLGARLISLAGHPEFYSSLPDMPLSYFISHSGKGIIGAIVGGYVSVALAKRAFKYTRSTGDCYAPAIPLAMAVGRIGCFLSELPLGTPTTLPWGISVSPDIVRQFPVCPGCLQSMHPSMLYEIAFHLLAFALILRYRHRVAVQGDTLKIYLLAAAVFRFWVEYVRGSAEMVFGLTGAQAVLIPMTALLLFHFYRNWRRGVYSLPVPPLAPGAVIVEARQPQPLPELERAV